MFNQVPCITRKWNGRRWSIYVFLRIHGKQTHLKPEARKHNNASWKKIPSSS